VFSGIQTEGKARANAGILGRESDEDAQRRFWSTNRNIKYV